MKRRDFFKLSSILASGGILSARQTVLASPPAPSYANLAKDTLPKICVIGLGNFGNRVIPRIAYENKHLLPHQAGQSSFLAWDRNSSLSGLLGSNALSESLVIFVAELGDTIDTNQTDRLAMLARKNRMFVMAVLSSPPEVDTITATQDLFQYRNLSDLVVVIDSTSGPSVKREFSMEVLRAKSLLRIEQRVCGCVAGLIRAIQPTQASRVEIAQIRSLMNPNGLVGFGAAGGGYRQTIENAVEEAFKQSLIPCIDGDNAPPIQSALVSFSGLPGMLKWTDVQRGKSEVLRLIGRQTPCLFSVRADNDGGRFGLKAEVWPIFGSAGG